MKRTMFTRASLAAGALVAGVLGGSMQAGAAPITVLNPGFESVTGTSPINWVGGFSDYTASWGSRTFSLAHNYNVDSGTQQTAYTVLAAGEEYTLTVQVPHVFTGSQEFPISAYTAELNLTLDSNIAAFNSSVPTAFATYDLLTTTYTSTLGDVGKTVGVLLGGQAYIDLYATNAHRVYFDNVSLVPEPATAGLIMMGMAGTLLAGRRRRNTK